MTARNLGGGGYWGNIIIIEPPYSRDEIASVVSRQFFVRPWYYPVEPAESCRNKALPHFNPANAITINIHISE